MRDFKANPAGRRTTGLCRVSVSKCSLPRAAARGGSDWVIVEEPLELRVAGEPLVVTMRTPGHDHELAVGFLVAEGLVQAASDLVSIQHCQGGDGLGQNVLDIVPASGSRLDQAMPEARPLMSSSACGLCGRQTIADLRQRLTSPAQNEPWPSESIMEATRRLREHQHNYEKTGGGHAAGVFDPRGTPHCIREDVGRHNAVDKVVGRLLLDHQLPAPTLALVVSGRVSFEIVQKAAMAGLGLVIGISAPTSLAVATASELGMTLVGFSRPGSFNVYSGTFVDNTLTP